MGVSLYLSKKIRTGMTSPIVVIIYYFCYFIVSIVIVILVLLSLFLPFTGAPSMISCSKIVVCLTRLSLSSS